MVLLSDCYSCLLTFKTITRTPTQTLFTFGEHPRANQIVKTKTMSLSLTQKGTLKELVFSSKSVFLVENYWGVSNTSSYHSHSVALSSVSSDHVPTESPHPVLYLLHSSASHTDHRVSQHLPVSCKRRVSLGIEDPQ